MTDQTTVKFQGRAFPVEAEGSKLTVRYCYLRAGRQFVGSVMSTDYGRLCEHLRVASRCMGDPIAELYPRAA